MAKKYNLDKVMTLDDAALCDLFGDGSSDKSTAEVNDRIKDVPVDLLDDYPQHKFNPIKDWEGYVEGIRLYGILTPLLLRQSPDDDERYQIIAGHNRSRAAKEVGLKTVPAMVVERNDVDASVLVGMTNKQREETTDVEWGRTYRVTYELLKRQGERTDLTSCHDGTKSESGDETTSCHDGTKFKGQRADEILAEKYGESARTIQRKMRLSYLIDNLADMYLDKAFNQKIAVELSYLTEKEQDSVCSVVFAEKVKVTEAMAKELREASAKNEAESDLTINDICQIMMKGEDPTEDAPKRDAKFSIPNTYFPSDLKKKEREQYVIRALRYIQEKGISLDLEGETE